MRFYVTIDLYKHFILKILHLIYMDKLMRFLIIFLGTYLLLLFVFPHEDKNDSEKLNDITIVASNDAYTIGDLVSVTIANNSDTDIDLGAGTPPEKVKIEKSENGELVSLHVADTPENTILKAHENIILSYPKNNTEFFNTSGVYTVKVEANIADKEKHFQDTIVIEEAGIFKTIWRIFFWKPVYNLFIGILDATSNNLGWTIILLTLFIKLLLFIPTQKGMKAQRVMQKLQPELERIKAKNAGNQQVIAMQTMELWKKHKVNPFSSIVPMLFQFPVLIALYYVIKGGLSEYQSFFLYHWTWFANFDYTNISYNFYGFLELLQTPLQYIQAIWLPVVVAIAQFFAMKLSFAKMKERNDKRKKDKNYKKPEGFMGDMQNEMQKMSGVFVYVLPVMILFFTMFLPLAIGVYWLISTLFSIGQQYAVNKMVDEEK